MVLSKSGIFVTCLLSITILARDVFSPTEYKNRVKVCSDEIKSVFMPLSSKVKAYAKSAFLYLRISDDPTKDTFTIMNEDGITIRQDAKAYYEHLVETIVSGSMTDPIHYCGKRKEKRKNEDIEKRKCIEQLQAFGIPWTTERRDVLVWIYKNIDFSELPEEAYHVKNYMDEVACAFQIIKDTMDRPHKFCLERYKDMYPED